MGPGIWILGPELVLLWGGLDDLAEGGMSVESIFESLGICTISCLLSTLMIVVQNLSP